MASSASSGGGWCSVPPCWPCKRPAAAFSSSNWQRRVVELDEVLFQFQAGAAAAAPKQWSTVVEFSFKEFFAGQITLRERFAISYKNITPDSEILASSLHI